jgi:hypothetical protein
MLSEIFLQKGLDRGVAKQPDGKISLIHVLPWANSQLALAERAIDHFSYIPIVAQRPIFCRGLAVVDAGLITPGA